MSKQDIPLIGPILNRIIGTRNDRFVKRYLARVEVIGKLEPRFRTMTDAQLRDQTRLFRERLDKGEKPEDLMNEAFAAAREAMDRAVGIRNVLNPDKNFDPSALPADARATYDDLMAKAAALPPAPPDGEFLGCDDAQPGWRQVEVPPAFYEAVRALYPESRPPFRARPFDVQLIGAMVLSQGRISEMKTGEGKTIVAPLACYLAALERMKIHVVTVNDYLVQRDRDWVFPFFHALGLTVGAIHPMHMQGEDVKRRMYLCDVVYGTTAEFGFDYLRDNMKRSVEQQVQRRRDFAIVDEVDSILIDEARTPLIISGSAHEDRPRYEMADRLARHLVDKQKPWQAAEDAFEECQRLIKGLEGDIRNSRDKAKIPALQERLKEAKGRLPSLEAEKRKHIQFYETKLERKSVHLTHDGVAEAQRVAALGSFYVGENMDLPHLLEQSLRAHVVYQRDRDYIVAPAENPNSGRVEPSIIIVDVSTGRPMVGRQWSDGLHQACEAKEGVPIKQENQTVATITIQNFFKMYKRLAGMTGTADTEAQEFHDIYRLDVVSIPTNRPVSRVDRNDLIFLTARDKWEAIVDEIKNFHDVGRPVLVGTTSVEKSEQLGQQLARKYQIKHEILNAKQHEREAHIVENAGQLGAVMIATNMAGRGTDIKLGKISREALRDHWLRREIAPATVSIDDTDEQLREKIYRKIAPKHLEINKREVESMPFPELELQLLRRWALLATWLSEKDVARLDAEGLRKQIDAQGRFLLHRIRWFATIEELGGLHVIGTERHESRRIDNQLRGRSGRQGDKGSSRFFISLEDDLMKLFAGETQMRVLSALGMKEGDAIEHPILSKSVENAQRKVEEINFQRRKNILEYDEVMEHQRRGFYGLRQRVLEGRDLKGLIFSYISDASKDAVSTYLSPDYPATCAAEFANQTLDCTINPQRLRGMEPDEMIVVIRTEAKQEIGSSIRMHLGEFIPDDRSEFQVDFDGEGLARWARSRFGVELDPSILKDPGPGMRRQISEQLTVAAEEKVEQADLAPISRFTAKGYGAGELCAWARNKFDLDLDPAEVSKRFADGGKESVNKLILEATAKAYRKREIEYPISFMMDMTKALVRQNPQQAMAQFINWANTRYDMGWSEETIRTVNPDKAREALLAKAEQTVDDSRMEKAVQAALACTTDDALEQHLRTTYKLDLPLHMRRLSGEERANAIRAKVESILRAELIMFERTMLLDVLDSLWKGHLYAMDQLRDGINFRAYSQQDPRIEYKREGSRMYSEMMQDVRERITDYVFRMRLAPQVSPMPFSPAPAPMAPPPAAAPASAAPYGAVLAGPGMGSSADLYPAPRPPQPQSQSQPQPPTA